VTADGCDRGVDIARVRQQLGRVGLWLGSRALGVLSSAREAEVLRNIEHLGFPAVWINEGKDALVHAAVVSASTERLTVATGVANIWRREPEAAVAGANTIAEAFGSRLILGIGVGHAAQVARYERPLEAATRYLERMHATHLKGPAPDHPTPWLLAALGPRMLDLAAACTQGSSPYFVPAEHTAYARDRLGGGRILAPELAVLLDEDRVSARATARRFMAMHLGLPNYTANLRRFGFGDRDFDDGGSDRLVDAIVAWGAVDHIIDRVNEHLEAGADHVALQPIDYGPDASLDTIRHLASTLVT
jgi:probable F420-dependent oxidoreductase